jgi:hypothetical protein
MVETAAEAVVALKESSLERRRLPRRKGAELEPEWGEDMEREEVEKEAGVVPEPVAAMMEGSA